MVLFQKPFLPDKFRQYNIKQTPYISIFIVSKYKTNKDFIKIIVYFDDTISSFSTKINSIKFTKIGHKNNKTFFSKEINETIKQLSK